MTAFLVILLLSSGLLTFILLFFLLRPNARDRDSDREAGVQTGRPQPPGDTGPALSDVKNGDGPEAIRQEGGAKPTGAELEEAPERESAPQAEDTRRKTEVTESGLPVFDFVETIPPFQEKRCCICNGELGWEFGVLFRAETGAEARIDRNCATKLNAAAIGSDRQEVIRSSRYLMSRVEEVDPKVAVYLKRYVKAAVERLRREDADE